MDLDRDFDRFLTVLTGVSDYYGKPLSEGVQQLYWQGLVQYDIEAVEKALWAHTQNPDSGQYMPKIADIVKMLQGSTADSALQAWSKVDRAVRSVGNYRSVVFEDPLIHRVITEMGGWIQFGTKTEDEWPFVRNEFVNRYRGYRMRGETPEYPPVLIGISEASNQKNNQKHREPPTLIGNPKQAERVMQLGTDKPILQIKQMDPEAASRMLRLVHSAE
jgi:hypothetical protein